MAGTLGTFAGLARLSIEDPRKGARVLLDLGVPLPARTAGLLLMAVSSAILIYFTSHLLPPTEDPLASFIAASPFRSAIMQLIVLTVSVVLIHRVGQARGGTGSFADAMLIVVWLQVLMLVLQVAQILALIIAPPLAVLLNFGGIVLFFWLMTNFIAELHGFTSRWAVFLGIILTAFAVAFALVTVLVLILGPGAFTNV